MRIFFGVLLVLKERMRSQLVMSNMARMARGGVLGWILVRFTLSGAWYNNGFSARSHAILISIFCFCGGSNPCSLLFSGNSGFKLLKGRRMFVL